MLRIVQMRFDHFLDRPRRIPQVVVLSEINCAHAAAANPTHDFVTVIQDLAGF